MTKRGYDNQHIILSRRSVNDELYVQLLGSWICGVRRNIVHSHSEEGVYRVLGKPHGQRLEN